MKSLPRPTMSLVFYHSGKPQNFETAGLAWWKGRASAVSKMYRFWPTGLQGIPKQLLRNAALGRRVDGHLERLDGGLGARLPGVVSVPATCLPLRFPPFSLRYQVCWPLLSTDSWSRQASSCGQEHPANCWKFARQTRVTDCPVYLRPREVGSHKAGLLKIRAIPGHHGPQPTVTHQAEREPLQLGSLDSLPPPSDSALLEQSIPSRELPTCNGGAFEEKINLCPCSWKHRTLAVPCITWPPTYVLFRQWADQLSRDGPGCRSAPTAGGSPFLGTPFSALHLVSDVTY